MSDPVIEDFKTLPIFERWQPRNYYYTPVERVFKKTADNLPLGGRYVVARADGSVDLTASVSFIPSIVFEELVYPGSTTMTAIRKWAYVYNARLDTLIVEAFLNNEASPGTAFSYRWNPTLAPDSKDNTPPKPGTAGWVFETDDTMGIMLPYVVGDKPRDYRCFVSPWRLNSRSLADMLANGRAKMADNWPAARIDPSVFLANTLKVTCIDPFAWAFDSKEALFDPRMNDWLEYASDNEPRQRRFIASVLKGVIDNGNKYDIQKSLATTPESELARLDAELEKKKRVFENSGAYLAATSLSGDDFIMVEKACLSAGLEGMEFLTVLWGTLTPGLGTCEPTRQFMTHVVAEKDRFFAQQILNPTPLVSQANFGTWRWLWYAACINLSEAVTAYRRMNSQLLKKLPTWGDYKRIIAVYGVHGIMVAQYDHDIQLTLRMDGRAKKLDAAAAKAIWDEAKAFNVRTVAHLQSANAILRANPQDFIEANDANFLGSKLGRIFGDTHALRYLDYVKTVKVSGKFLLDTLNVLIAWDAYQQSDEGQQSGAIISLAGASADFSALLFENIGAARAIENKVALWGRIPWKAAAGTMAVLGVVSGLCDGYAMDQDLAKGWGRHDTGRMVGATIGLVGAGMTVVGGALAICALVCPTIFAATGWAGPFGLAVGAVAAGFLFVGSMIIIFFGRNNPWQDFASHSFLGTERDAEKTTYFDWSPHDGSMPCKSLGGKRQIDREARILYSLISNYVVGVEKEIDRRSFEKGDPATLYIQFAVPDEGLTLSVTVEQTWKVSLVENDKLIRELTLMASGMKFSRDKLITGGNITGPDTMALRAGFSKIDFGDNHALRRVAIPIQPAIARRHPGQKWQPFETYEERAALLETWPFLQRITATVRIDTPGQTIRPYAEAYQIKIFEYHTVSDDKIKEAPTWELKRM